MLLPYDFYVAVAVVVIVIFTPFILFTTYLQYIRMLYMCNFMCSFMCGCALSILAFFDRKSFLNKRVCK